MPYRSEFEFRSGGLGPYVGAIAPASIASTFVGMVVLAAWAVVATAGPVVGGHPLEFAFAVVMAGLALGLGVVLAAFVVGFYLALFGLPVALLLGRHIHHPWALAVALIDAAGSAFIATTGSRLGLLGDDFAWRGFLMVLLFAVPAGYLYRRSVIAFREEAELMN